MSDHTLAKSVIGHKTSIRETSGVVLSTKKFDVNILPDDMQRIYETFEKKHGREYALLVIFNMRTAIELHRAWHMSLLTSKIMQKVKDKFNLRMNWQLGVIRIRFLMDDGLFQLYRRIPYDYDSEYQDMFTRIAYALCHNDLNVDEALIFQEEAKQGRHTAKSGTFLRDFPGRLILYPALSSTCAVIFFGGDWEDAGIAAITGLATGISTLLIESMGSQFGVLVDIAGGLLTGLIGALFFHYNGRTTCLKSVFLGTLYWFFYGTAFTVGLLEIVAGELETGVTRFMAVSIKTFVLSTCAAAGMALALKHPAEAWEFQRVNNCGHIDLDVHWWRIPLYLASSAAALGQYRFRIVEYWRGLIVQLIGYEVQYQVFKALTNVVDSKSTDRIDTTISNIAGASAAVVTATILAYIVNTVNQHYYGNLFKRSKDNKFVYCVTKMIQWKVKLANCIGVGREDERRKLWLAKRLIKQQKELKDIQHPRQRLDEFTLEEETLILDTIVLHQPLNVWSMLMPAVYQLVPGSMIANLWFSMIFPVSQDEDSFQSENVFGDLMVTSMSLALGLIIGFFITFLMKYIVLIFKRLINKEAVDFINHFEGMVAAPTDAQYDDPLVEDEKKLLEKMKSSLNLNVAKEQNAFETE